MGVVTAITKASRLFLITMASSQTKIHTPTFVHKYMDRLGLDLSTLQGNGPLDYQALCQITEAHLANIPFENLGQHGGKGGVPTLNMQDASAKILDRHRGGFCFELNGLLAMLLEELGMEVLRVPAIVFRPDPDNSDAGFDHPKTHLFLLVRLQPTSEYTADVSSDDGSPESGTQFFIDVGFGEPAIHPLVYPLFGKTQLTAEGMQSRFVATTTASNSGTTHPGSDGGDRDKVILEYFKDGKWSPRLMWDAAIDPSNTMADLQPMLEEVLQPDSNFSKKIIVCRIDRTMKYTLAGTKLKQTGPPRIVPSSSDGSQVTVQDLQTLEEVRAVLKAMFGITLEETERLELFRSANADEKVWSGF